MALPLKPQSGASIVEICITVVVIALTTLLIMSFSRNSLMLSQNSRANDAAYFAAEEKIANLASTALTTYPSGVSDNITVENITFTRTWTVTQSGKFPPYATVTVTCPSLKNFKSITLAGAVN